MKQMHRAAGVRSPKNYLFEELAPGCAYPGVGKRSGEGLL